MADTLHVKFDVYKVNDARRRVVGDVHVHKEFARFRVRTAMYLVRSVTLCDA